MHIDGPHGGNGADRLDHMADHVDDGQVDDGPVITHIQMLCYYWMDGPACGWNDSSPLISSVTPLS